VPVEQIASPTYDYGFKIDLVAVTPAGAGGIYAPGSDVQFRITLRDGSGKPLHEPGNCRPITRLSGPQRGRDSVLPRVLRPDDDLLPTQAPPSACDESDHRSGPEDPGGRTPIRARCVLGPDDVQTVATPTRDGCSAVHNDPDRARFVRRCVRYNARRLGRPRFRTRHLSSSHGCRAGHLSCHRQGAPQYLGQDIPYSKTVQLQVGTPTHTDPVLRRPRVQRVPQRSIELGTVNHANSNRAACAGCHAPLSFELEGPSMSARTSSTAIEAVRCAAEQVLLLPHTKESTQRTSKSACLSCHNSYPKSHVEKFGPIRGMYFGGLDRVVSNSADKLSHEPPGSGL